MNNSIAQNFEHKRNYINSLENLFRDENAYGFEDYIANEFQQNPDNDFYDITMGRADMLFEPVSDADGNYINLDPKSRTLDEDLKEYIYNLLLNSNSYD